MDLISINPETQTMSSLDLAKLCVGDKKDAHANFVKKMKKVIGEEGVVNFYDTYLDKSKRQSAYYNLPEREACLMAMSYSYELQAYVYDAWQALKNKPMSRKQIALMIIQAEEAKERAELEVARLQGVCNTITAQFCTGVTVPKFCKQLNGVNTQQVNDALIEMGYLRRSNNGIVPVAYARDRYFKEVQKEYNGKMCAKAVLTLIGAKWLYRAYLSNKLPMRSSWDNKMSHLVFEM